MDLLKGAEFWVLIAFVIAAAVLAWKASPPVGRQLDARAAKIKDELDAAKRLRDEAERALSDYQRKQRDAMKEAGEIVARAREEAERAAARAVRDIEASLERRKRAASEKIALEEAKALAEVRNEAIEVALAAVRQALAEALGPEKRAALLDDAIASLPHALN